MFKNVIALITLGGKNARGIRVSSYDPEDPANQQSSTTMSSATAAAGGPPQLDAAGNVIPSKTLGNQRKFVPGSQRVATISQHYNEKTMLLSSDDEYQ